MTDIAKFPIARLRRLRGTASMRHMFQDTILRPQDFIYPLFVRYGSDIQKPIGSMSGQYQWSVDKLAHEARQIATLGIPAVILFGIPKTKDARGSDNYNPDGVVPRAIRAIKDAVPELVVASDMCFCEYDAAGFQHVAVMSYAAKYASTFYGPFRDAAESLPRFGDRRQYQMDPANRREALREVALDVAEGADILMIKPALPYLDVLSGVRQAYNLPVAAYQVSGEYAMLHAAAANGWLDLRGSALESLISIKRAGADLILTYFAKDAARWLEE